MSIVDTKLINCNRITSVEVKSGNNSNPAYFTNQLDETLILDVGDQISVERSFISEVGAGNSQVIEFKGATLKENQKIPYTKITPSAYVNDPFDENYRMGFYQVYQASEEEHTYDLKDNEAYIRYGYYINADDHPYYITLPRRFITDKVDTPDDETRFTDRDETIQGMTHFTVQTDNFAVCDYYRYKTKDNKIIPKLKIDGSRYALYVLKTTSFNNNTGYGTQMMPYTPTENASRYREHVAINTWYPYNEIKKISIKEGFNTSTEIADQISNQLNESETPEAFNIGYEVTGERYLRAITTTVEAPTYRLFNSANIVSMNASNFTDYLNNASTGGQPSTNSQLYYSSYQYIGVKRPELWNTGRAIPSGALVRPEINPNATITMFEHLVANRQVDPIEVNWEWNQNTLEKISAFLKAQELYPELFDNLSSLTSYNGNPLITNTRYLHINKWGSSSGSLTGGNFNNALGSDGYGTSNQCLSSIPIFIEYRKNQENIYYEPDQQPAGVYAFGFATPYLHTDGKYYITIHPEGNGLGGIPLELYNEPDITTAKIEGGRWIGYDPHFTAFGTACVLLNSGAYIFNPLNPVSEQKIQQKPATTFEKTAKYFTQRYVGANNPICQFNQDTNRYEFIQLHEALNVGNDKLAGDTANTPFVDVSADAGDVVYKFNPKIESFGFSPNFKPYLKPVNVQLNYPHLPKSNIPASDTSTNLRAFDLLNENIQPYSLFDSRSGIYIDNWGVDSENWEASLWGTMGFSYEQFHAVLTQNNVLLRRIDNLNYQSLRFLTTNSEQATTDTKAWVSNAFNAPMYELGLAQGRALITYIPSGLSTLPVWEPHSEIEIIPAIINKTQSMTIASVNLSRSMIRPYYTIRSNIIEDTSSNVNGALLPIVSVVDKYSAQGDFYFGNPSSITFTITKPTYISSITTSIHDPDGKFANVNNSSAIIYKINKQRPPPPNILEEILKEEKANKKK